MKNGITNRLQQTSHPLLYEVNIRVLLNELSARAGRKITLGTIPQSVIDEWSDLGFDAVWLMGVWTTGKVGLDIARTDPNLLDEYKRVLPDCMQDDIIGSPYAVKSYTVSTLLGGNAALLSLRKRLAKKGMGIVLDFVCNHTSRDHTWVAKHPEYYVQGISGDEIEKPDLFFKTTTLRDAAVVAFGRDPYFSGWTDTAQLNYMHGGARTAIIRDLKRISGMCDGVRCDMAMLILHDVFEKTWGGRVMQQDDADTSGEFWKEAIAAIRKESPDFLFIAEAYWNLEWKLQQLGFDFTYDKTLYERLLREGAYSVHGHLGAEPGYQKRSVRFIENHDEPRAAQILSSEPWHFAAAVVMATVPGMILFHEGQLAGRKTKIPVQLGRRPDEQISEGTTGFYQRLLSCLGSPVFKKGKWQLLEIKPAWHENHTWNNFLAFWWVEKSAGVKLIVVNYAPNSGQCYVTLSLDDIEGTTIEFRDLMGNRNYARERHALNSKGMYFDLPGYSFHIFDVAAVRKPVF